MKLRQTALCGCNEIIFPAYEDKRGSFAKAYNRSLFASLDFEFRFAEVYFSSSKKNVIRGMHFQIPPYEHTKIVTCISGHAFDVVIDLRRKSSTYGQSVTFDLRGNDGRGVLIPPGFAHGFCSLQTNTVMSYFVSTEHSPDHDMGIHWASAAVTWPTKNPIISQRDEVLPALSEFETPF